VGARPARLMRVNFTATDSERATLAARYPCLRLEDHAAGMRLLGTFPVLHEGRELDSFTVRVELTGLGASFEAEVFEEGGRIPKRPDRHVHPSGACCIGLPDALVLREGGKPIPLLRFLDEPVQQYFLGQLHVEAGDPWPFGEFGHGDEGRAEFYAELFGEPFRMDVARRFLVVLANPKGQKHWFCPCRSGRGIRSGCHRATLERAAARVSPSVARELLAVFDDHDS